MTLIDFKHDEHSNTTSLTFKQDGDNEIEVIGCNSILAITTMKQEAL